jgi:hypothetical protein
MNARLEAGTKVVSNPRAFPSLRRDTARPPRAGSPDRRRDLRVPAKQTLCDCLADILHVREIAVSKLQSRFLRDAFGNTAVFQ